MPWTQEVIVVPVSIGTPHNFHQSVRIKGGVSVVGALNHALNQGAIVGAPECTEFETESINALALSFVVLTLNNGVVIAVVVGLGVVLLVGLVCLIIGFRVVGLFVVVVVVVGRFVVVVVVVGFLVVVVVVGFLVVVVEVVVGFLVVEVVVGFLVVVVVVGFLVVVVVAVVGFRVVVVVVVFGVVVVVVVVVVVGFLVVVVVGLRVVVVEVVVEAVVVRCFTAAVCGHLASGHPHDVIRWISDNGVGCFIQSRTCFTVMTYTSSNFCSSSRNLIIPFKLCGV